MKRRRMDREMKRRRMDRENYKRKIQEKNTRDETEKTRDLIFVHISSYLIH